jgi:hypothetical protein
VAFAERPARDLALIDAVDGCTREQFAGPVWRVCRSGRDPVQGGPSRSRWCDGSFDVLYTALERDGAVAEIHALLSLQPVFPSQVSWTVYRVSVRAGKALRIADLAGLAPFGIETEKYGERSYARTQAMAEAAFFLGFDGLVVPSARWTCLNAILFTARVAPADLAIEGAEPAPVDWDNWRRRHFDALAARLRAATARRHHTPSDLSGESSDDG